MLELTNDEIKDLKKLTKLADPFGYEGAWSDARGDYIHCGRCHAEADLGAVIKHRAYCVRMAARRLRERLEAGK